MTQRDGIPTLSGFKRVNDEVFVATRPIVQVTRKEIEALKAQATRNPRQRVRLCAHKDVGDRLHEMLIVLTKDVYIRPHKHLGKTESFHVIEGAADVLFFRETGEMDEIIHIGDFRSGKQFYFRNDDSRYHTQIITTDFLVFHETTTGPFNSTDTVFAPWSPDETNAQAVRDFIEQLKNAIFRK